MQKRITMTILSFLFLFGTWFAFAPLQVDACSCAETPSIEDQLQRKTAIFTGKVLRLTKPVNGKIWSSEDAVKVQFEVKKVWKGDLGSQTTVYTARSSESCGYEGFGINEEFIVFAYGEADRLETGLCEGNKNLESAQEEIKALGVGYEPSKMTSTREEYSDKTIVTKESNNWWFMVGSLLVVFLAVCILRLISLRGRRR
ncbi:hypothetical protein FHS16_005610 [Paenibacillus endophyticus]|uniref:Tissue inhibitor of metalloproteinase n=1 Tax=Paenibacillus endophyticus TaxID=1294268 RepID=A0A7W5GDV6_9BACL|nr:hypothetical protein [Paenibacillus endophyticus]MBB3155502.1 hypothetical protein [Paenibacillus endophyticus]